MIPNWTFFGWMTLITETFIGVTLILGPALAQADVGVAMGVAGSDAAIEAARVALMGDDWGRCRRRW